MSVAILMAGVGFGQVASKPLEFEVASIKPHAPGETSSSTNLVSGGINATNVTLRQLMVRAYDIQDFQLLSGPAWINDDRWDIMARTPDFVMPQDPNSLSDQQRKTIQEQMQERLRNLLIDRFRLAVRLNQGPAHLRLGGGEERSEAPAQQGNGRQQRNQHQHDQWKRHGDFHRSQHGRAGPATGKKNGPAGSG